MHTIAEKVRVACSLHEISNQAAVQIKEELLLLRHGVGAASSHSHHPVPHGILLSILLSILPSPRP